MQAEVRTILRCLAHEKSMCIFLDPLALHGQPVLVPLSPLTLNP